MFAVDNILISDDVVDAPFSCNLGACHGACCVQGDSGAPLDPDERDQLDAVLALVKNRLRPEARAVIAERGAWEQLSPGEYATTCVGGAECVFVVYEGPVAKCAIHTAHLAGKTDFAKPISCHLFPIRAEQMGEYEVLNYEQVSICDPAIRHGRRTRSVLPEMLKEPLIRKYGAQWYDQFKNACEERREILTQTT